MMCLNRGISIYSFPFLSRTFAQILPNKPKEGQTNSILISKLHEQKNYCFRLIPGQITVNSH